MSTERPMATFNPPQSLNNKNISPAKSAVNTAETAASKVLGTFELLEAILLNLPCPPIYVIRRVSKYWKEVIEGSFKLQVAWYQTPVRVAGITTDHNCDILDEGEANHLPIIYGERANVPMTGWVLKSISRSNSKLSQ